jgi:hypothetical protein
MVPNCGDDVRVQVAAVNRVGCLGMNSSEVQPILLDIPTAPADNVSITTIEGGSASTSSKHLKIANCTLPSQKIIVRLFDSIHVIVHLLLYTSYFIMMYLV